VRRLLLLAVTAYSGAATPPVTTNTGAPLAAVPSAPDEDGDWIEGAADRCPAQAEDYDVWEDEDGCPDPDDDHDGVPDEVDGCPYTPGTSAGDACPDGCVFVTNTADCILDTLAFVGSPHEEAGYEELVEELARYPEVLEVTLAGSWFAPETPADARPRLEHARDRLRAHGWPERIAIVLGAPTQAAGPDLASAIHARITRQRFALDSKFRQVVACSRSAGPIIRPAKADYRCKGIYP
jgi:hypothetical protein